MRHAAWWVAALTLVLLGACGSGGGGGDGGAAAGGGDGGGGGSPPLPAPDLSLAPNADFVGSFSGLNLMFTDDANLVVGGHGNDGIRRCVVGFDLDALAGATLTRATLRVDFMGIRGTPYFNLGGRVVVDRVDLGPTLDVTDARAPFFEEAFGTISADRVLGEKRLDVTTQVQAAIDAGAARVDFRLYFPIPPTPNRGHDWQTLGLRGGTFLDVSRAQTP